MSYSRSDYDGERNEDKFFERAEAEDRARESALRQEEIDCALIDARMVNFQLGRCSSRAADDGGELYEREMRAYWRSRDAGEIATPVADAVDGWLRAMRVGQEETK